MAGTNIGSIYAEAELNIEKFKASAIAMGGATGKIVESLNKADASLAKTQARLEELSLSQESARAKLESAQKTYLDNASALDAMQITAEEAAITAAELGTAYERAAAQFGETSMQAYMAADEYEAAAKSADKLGAAVEKQEAKVAKNQATFKKAEAAVKKYESKISDAEKKISKFTSKIEGLNKQLSDIPLADASISFEEVSASGEAFNDILEAVKDKGLRGFGSSLSTSIGQLDLFKNATGATGTALHTLQRSVTSVINALGSSASLILAGSIAAGYGAYKFYEYASGANAAREAQEKLNAAAQKWSETDVTTSYEKSDGMKGMGLSEGDFSGMIKPARNWMDEVTRVWSDGKKETDEIVKNMTAGFTSETDTVRSGIEGIKQAASSGGFAGDGFLAGLDTDMTRLDEIDKQVEKLLKKKQNGKLTDKDKTTLQGLYDEREEISIKYHLESDGTDNTAFDQIVQNAEAALARGAEGGAVWADSFAAATQGLGAYKDALNSEYDAQYKLISLMAEGSEEEKAAKTAALDALNAWYTEQKTAATQEYNEALQKTLELTGALGKDGSYNEVGEKLKTISDLMNDLAEAEGAGNTEAAAAASAELSAALSELDETQVVEITAALVAMQTAATDSGTELDASVKGVLDSIESIKTSLGTDVFSGELFDSLNKMFGENLDGEVKQVYAALNLDSLSASFDAWAAGEHAEIIPTLSTEPLDATALTLYGSVSVNGTLVTITAADGTTYTIDGVAVGVDGELLTITAKDGTTYTVEGVSVGINGELLTVTKKDGQTYSITDFTVDVTGEVATITTKEGTTYTIDDFTVGVDGELLTITAKDGTTYTVDGFVAEVDGELGTITGKDGTTYTVEGVKAGVDGELTVVTVGEGCELPTIKLKGEVTEVTPPKNNFFPDGKLTNSANPTLEFAAASGSVEKVSTLHVPSDTGRNLKDLATAIDTYNTAVEAGDTTTANAWLESIQTLSQSLGTSLDAADGAGFQELAQYVANGLALLGEGGLDEGQAAELQATIDALLTVLGSDIAVNSSMTDTGYDLASGLAEGLGKYQWNTDASTVAKAIYEALGIATGQGSPCELTKPTGYDLSGGVGVGMKEYDFSSDASAVSAHILSAFSTIDLSNAGLTAAASVGSGLAGYDISCDASGLASSAISALVAKMGSSDANTIGLNFSNGLARGILNGKSGVISAATQVAKAAAQAAKDALDIHSPSRVSEELGEFFDLGFIEGITNVQPRIDDAIREALYIEPQNWALHPSYEAEFPYGAATQSAAHVEIDYDRLAAAMSRHNMVLELDGKKVAAINANNTAIAANRRSRSIALGFGK